MAQLLPRDHITDVRVEVRQRLLESGFLNNLKRGARIAITAGSRGMGGFVDLIAGIVDAVKASGGEPFVIPAMGSHGGATEAGQTEILQRLGVTEEATGAPVRATMDTHSLGPSTTGAVAHLDSIAAEADGIIVLARTKTHPENTAGVASGLLKMVTVRLGKQPGAQEAHTHGLWPSVNAVPELTMARAKILCGVAVVENGFRQPAIVNVVAPTYDAFHDSDEQLLEAARPHVAKIPFQHLDLLIVDQLGKNISGTGMDLNVIGNWRMSGGPPQPDYRRIVALSLTRESLGNGLGIGLADFTTRRFMDEYDPAVTYVNLLTATEPPIVVLEPSCATVFREELTNFFPEDEDAKRLRDQTFLLSDFLEQRVPDFSLPHFKHKVLLHGHCHHKNIMKMEAEESILKKMQVEYEMPDTGCCGMAGAFGFEKEHYDVSMKCGERVLLPAVRAQVKDALIVTDGFSCREQIAQSSDRQALHLAEVLQMALDQHDAGKEYPERDYLEAHKPKASLSVVEMGLLAGAATLGVVCLALRRKASQSP